MRVAVVGAGLAGLSATESLIRDGVDVEVIEAGRRFGGRAHTIRDRFAFDNHAESGAEWVDSVHWRMADLMGRFGVRTVGEGMRWTTIRRWLVWDGQVLSGDRLDDVDPDLSRRLAEYEALVDSPAAEMRDASDPNSHPNAAELDARSLADAMRECGLDGPAGLLARRNSEGEFAADPRQVSLLFVAQQRAQERELLAVTGQPEVLARRVEGGVSNIAERWGAEISAQPRVTMNFASRVLAVHQTSDGVELSLIGPDGARSLSVDQLVLATSLVPLREIEFRSPLPVDLQRAIDGLSYGSIVKTAVQFARRDWAAGYGTTESVAQRIYDCSVDQRGEAGILMSYCGGEGGQRLGELDEEQRIDLITGDMRRIHRLAHPVVGAFSRAWSTDPMFGGAYAVYSPGQVSEYWDVLRRPWGRVHLAGEHVATCTGYMEGAVESGRRVAERIVG